MNMKQILNNVLKISYNLLYDKKITLISVIFLCFKIITDILF